MELESTRLDRSQRKRGDGDYDPHEFRNVENPTTNCETLVHILKGSIGTGILAMPQAFNHTGYVNGVISTIIVGALCTYCLHLLIKMQYKLCQRHQLPYLTYPDAMKLALKDGPACLKWLSPASVCIVDGFLIVYQMGICCVYIVFVSKSIKQFADFYIGEAALWVHMFCLLPLLLLLSLIPNLKKMAIFSTIANVITFVGLFIVFYYIFEEMPTTEGKVTLAPIDEYPLFFGTVLFALEAVGVIIAVENKMKDPKSFGGYCGVFNQGMFVVIGLYATMGVFGYLKYGDEAYGSITLNIPKDEALAQACKLMFAFAIFISFALQGYVPVNIAWNDHLKKRIQNESRHKFWEYFIRLGNVSICFLLALAIPRLGLFISLFGALCLSVLGFLFPAVMELCVHWPDNLGPFKYILFKDLTLAFIAITGLICGTYVALRDIVRSFEVET